MFLVCEKIDAKVISFMANLKQAVLDAVDIKVAAEEDINITFAAKIAKTEG